MTRVGQHRLTLGQPTRPDLAQDISHDEPTQESLRRCVMPAAGRTGRARGTPGGSVAAAGPERHLTSVTTARFRGAVHTRAPIYSARVGLGYRALAVRDNFCASIPSG